MNPKAWRPVDDYRPDANPSFPTIPLWRAWPDPRPGWWHVYKEPNVDRGERPDIMS